MSSSVSALSFFAALLKMTVEASDISRFRDFLEGGELPALGGNLEPAEIIRRAVLQSAEPSKLSREIAKLLALVVSEEIESLRASERLTPRNAYRILNALYMAVDFPSDEELFRSLKRLRDRMEELQKEDKTDLKALWFPLWRALVHQQTDDSLESDWYAILRGEEPETLWTPERQTLLLTAWRGLLWIPPDLGMRQLGKIINFDRVEKGLLALYESVRDGAEEAPLLRTALGVLTETYPRSPEFWVKHLGSRSRNWPSALRDIALMIWPDLESAETVGSSPEAVTDEELRYAYELLERARRRTEAALRSQEALQETWRGVLEGDSPALQRAELIEALRRIEDFTRRLGDIDQLGQRRSLKAWL